MMQGYNGDNFIITEIQDLFDLMTDQIIEISDVQEALHVYCEGGRVDYRYPMSHPVLMALQDGAITAEGAVDCIEAIEAVDGTYA